MELQIHHTGNQDGDAMFEVIRSMDMKRTAAVALPDPAKFPVEGHPAKQFLPELRWYLEDYLQSPFGVYPQLAECVAKTMQAWGASVFDTLFTGHARDWYRDAKRQNFENFRIKVTSDSPEVMSWSWEALYSRDDGWLALRCCIDRQLSCIDDPPPFLAYHVEKMRRFVEADQLYSALAEKTGPSNDWKAAASAYHQLGRIAQEEGDFTGAKAWYKKSLDIFEKQGDESGAASTCHQLGRAAEGKGDFAGAKAWYKKSLAIKEKQGNGHGAALTYHQLGIIAQKQGDFTDAKAWYKKSLDIFEKQGNGYGATSTYHQLGIIAQEEGDFTGAKAWYKKSLAIKEKQGNGHGAALTYHQLGMVAEGRQDFLQAGDFYLKSIKMLVNTSDIHTLMIVIFKYAFLLHTTAGTGHSQLRQAWSTCMPQELTEILEEMEAELNDASS